MAGNTKDQSAEGLLKEKTFREKEPSTTKN